MNFNGKSNAEIRQIYQVMSRDKISPFEYKLESEFRRMLSTKDYRNLNLQSQRYKEECGECMSRRATNEELEHFENQKQTNKKAI